MADKLPLIGVKGVSTDKTLENKVLLWERHPDHPEGEALVVNDGKAYQVAETKEVKRLIGEGVLERVNWNSREVPKNKGGRPKRNGGVPELRPATDQEEENAEPPVRGFPDEDTSRVPVN